MITRVKRIFGMPHFSTGVDAYYNSVHRTRSGIGPTYTEAQRDFRELARRYSHSRI